MILIFDTETTGLPDFRARSADASQPHLVQLALLLCEEDGTEVDRACVIVKPDGWVIPPEVTAIHGISHEQALEEGMPEDFATGLFVGMHGRAALRVAHNESFDRRVMRIAMTRAGIDRADIEAIEARPAACTCNMAKPILKLPPTEKMKAAGFNTFKTPNLTECVRHFLGEEPTQAHDALGDALDCMRIYFHMKALAVPA